MLTHMYEHNIIALLRARGQIQARRPLFYGRGVSPLPWRCGPGAPFLFWGRRLIADASKSQTIQAWRPQNVLKNDMNCNCRPNRTEAGDAAATILGIRSAVIASGTAMPAAGLLGMIVLPQHHEVSPAPHFLA